MFGARPLKRVIQQQLQNPLATEILKGEFAAGSGVKIDWDDNRFTFSRDTGTVEDVSEGFDLSGDA